jgi:hypothetical protein
MTTRAKERHKQEKESVNKYYKPTRHISWIEIIPKYISPREAAALSTEEKEKLLKPFERPRFPLPDLPPLARIRLFRQDLLGADTKQVPLLLPRSQTNPRHKEEVEIGTLHPRQGKRVAQPGRSRKTETGIRKALLSEPLGELGHNRPNSIRKV